MPFFRRLLGALVVLSAAVVVPSMAVPTVAEAQQVDIIRGQVLGTDSLPIANVLVTATTLSGNVSRTQRTDRNGRYTISFPGGEGDYWVTFSGIGLAPRRYQVKRTADQEILIANARMAPAAITLDAVQVTERAAVSRSDTVSDVSGTERTVSDEIAGFLNAEQMGDLAAMASAIPGVQLLLGADGGADAFSVFGLGGDQNNTQLNGLNFGDAQLPRDANVMTSLSTSPYDVSRGGFSGGQLQVRTRAGSNFSNRSVSSNFVSPQLQWADRVGVATGQQYTNASFGGAASGPIKPDVLFYNTSLQFDRRLQDFQTALNTNVNGFQAAGVSADSVRRMLDILGTDNVPFTIDGYSPLRIQTTLNTLNSFDWVPQNSSRGSTYSVTLSANYRKTTPVGSGGGGGGGFGGGGFGGFGGSLITPTRDGERTNWGGAAQLRHSGMVGWKGIFTETTVGYSTSRNAAEPYTFLPSGAVRVNSQFADGTASVGNLQFGGNPALNNSSITTTLAGNNTLSWFSKDNRHRVKLTTELRREDFSNLFNFNEYGSFSYNTLADLQANRPASFTRLLSPRTRTGSQYVAAMSLGDAWRPTNDLQVQYGVRVDGNKFNMGPQTNADVRGTFQYDNAEVPNRLYVSPRIGFSWTLGEADQLALMPGMIRAPRAVVRGGLGVFQNTPGTQLISGAIDNTGLPSGLQQLTCVGEATPTPDWSAYAADRGAIPTTCADGTSGSVFANSNPNVTLFLPDYQAQRSIRGNLQWMGAVLKNRFVLSADVTYSRNQRQQGGIDLNFTNQQQFSLDGEGGRPMFVTPDAIVSTTGQVAWRQARVSDKYGRVTAQTSSLEGESRQLNLSLRPTVFNSRWGWNLNYVLADVREQFLGFNSTVGTPVGKEWSPGGFFSRHAIQYSLSYNAWDAVRISWNGRFSSGFRYTPTINQDVNGDSYGNDRAFVFDPSTVSDPLLRTGLESLLANGTREATACLRSQMGQFAERNSCVGPWSMTGNLNFSLNSLKLGLPQRANISLQVANPLNGIDRLLNGEDGLKGWGAQQLPQSQQQLLFVRGFDPVTRAFKYEVNERFGSTRPRETTLRSQPVMFTLQVRYDVGQSREQQQLLQQLDRGRTRPGNKPSLQQLRQTANVGIINPMQQLLQQADTLKLTRKQADSLATLNRLYVLKSDSVWTPVARFLSELPDRYSHGDAYGRYRRAREETVDVLIRIVPGIRGLLTPEQIRILPDQLVQFLDKRTLQGIRSGTVGNNRFGGGGGRMGR
ncbi:MAG: carboxypeptidase regulatory-like domain-containing protein [Gemmatimonadaceae bacterium]|nr:carboxypeptidase regulatory-like domain-containing protein [Gemmatimonadaceae bacterium]